MHNFLTRPLKKAGYEVVTVAHGIEALPHSASGQFDLLLTDIIMPGMDCIELARWATKMYKDLP